MSRPETLPRYLTAGEAAEILRTSRKAIYVMVERRQLPGVRKIGKRLLISASILLSWIEDQRGASSLPENQR